MANIDCLAFISHPKDGKTRISFFKRSDGLDVEKDHYDLEYPFHPFCQRIPITEETYEMLKKEKKMGEEYKILYPQGFND